MLVREEQLNTTRNCLSFRIHMPDLPEGMKRPEIILCNNTVTHSKILKNTLYHYIFLLIQRRNLFINSLSDITSPAFIINQSHATIHEITTPGFPVILAPIKCPDTIGSLYPQAIQSVHMMSRGSGLILDCVYVNKRQCVARSHRVCREPLFVMCSSQ